MSRDAHDLDAPHQRAYFVAQPGQGMALRVAALASNVDALGSLSLDAEMLSCRSRRMACPPHDLHAVRLVRAANQMLSEVGCDARLVPLSERDSGQAYAMATVGESIDMLHDDRLAISELADLVSYAGW